MFKSITHGLLVSVVSTLILSPVFANGSFDSVESQYFDGQAAPAGEKSYFATLAPISSGIEGYIGMNASLGMATFQPEIVVSTTTIGSSDFKNKKIFNYGGGVYGGLGTNFNHFYIGAELSAGSNIPGARSADTINGSNVSLTVRQPMIAGIDIVPGYLTQGEDVLFYGRLGLGSSLYRLKFTNADNQYEDTVNKLVFGLRAGLGLEFFLSETFSLRTEYVYSKYGTIGCSEIVNGSAPDYTYNVSSPASHQVNLGLTIHF